MDQGKVEEARRLMAGFAERTGLSSTRPPRRYLWTDAFAVCNWLAIERLTKDSTQGVLAERLVDQVHLVLGRHRADAARGGWLSGLDDDNARLHPTRGGLRIGKPLPERAVGEWFDERLEWERDGQYFHYLTKWMHALDQLARAKDEPRYNLWARELAERAYAAFVLPPVSGAPPRMAWKMSVDLSRPLLPSMGQHDPLDGLVTFAELRATAKRLIASQPMLSEELAGLRAMAVRTELATDDPLGLGGLLIDAARVAQLAGDDLDWALVASLLEVIARGIRGYVATREPDRARLAFRELGLAIGLEAIDLIERVTPAMEARAIRALLRSIDPWRSVGVAILDRWRDPAHRRGSAWLAHEDINDVMLASALVPEGVLTLSRARVT